MNHKVKENIVIIIIVSFVLVAIISVFVLISMDDDLIPNQWVLELVLVVISFLIFLIPVFVDRSNLISADAVQAKGKVSSINKTKRIRVDLSKCKLECSSSYERVESNNPAEINNHWEGLKPSKNVITNVKNSECVLVFEMDWKGKMVRFESDMILKDEITLSFLLEKQKTIDLYIKPNGEYFFDLDFLE